MIRIGAALMRGGFLAVIALVVFRWSLATPFVASWKDAWVAACVAEAGGLTFGCMDCDPYGCDAQFRTLFLGLPLLGILALLIGGLLLFGIGKARARIMAEKEA